MDYLVLHQPHANKRSLNSTLNIDLLLGDSCQTVNQTLPIGDIFKLSTVYGVFPICREFSHERYEDLQNYLYEQKYLFNHIGIVATDPQAVLFDINTALQSLNVVYSPEDRSKLSYDRQKSTAEYVLKNKAKKPEANYKAKTLQL